LKSINKNTVVVKNEIELQNVIANNTSVVLAEQESSLQNTNPSVGIDLNSYNNVVCIDRAKKEITVQSGISLEKLYVLIEACGWSIPCIPSNSKQMLCNAINHGAHGSNGQLLGNYIVNFRLISAYGKCKEIKEEDIEINAVKFSLGKLGIFSEITFRCEEKAEFHITATSQKTEVWLTTLEESIDTYDYLKINWFPHTKYMYIQKGNKIDKSSKQKKKRSLVHQKDIQNKKKSIYGFVKKNPKAIVRANKILRNLFYRKSKEQIGSLYTTTTSRTATSNKFKTSWFLPVGLLSSFFQELEAVLVDKDQKVYMPAPVEINFLQKDSILMSPAYQQDVVVINYETEYMSEHSVVVINQFFRDKGAKPCGEQLLHLSDIDLKKLYPNYKEFQKLKNTLYT